MDKVARVRMRSLEDGLRILAGNVEGSYFERMEVLLESRHVAAGSNDE
jgi:hypothetical protein